MLTAEKMNAKEAKKEKINDEQIVKKSQLKRKLKKK